MANEAWSGIDVQLKRRSELVRPGAFQQCRVAIGCEHERGLCKRRAGFVGFLGVSGGGGGSGGGAGGGGC
jgi:hypothetical protein